MADLTKPSAETGAGSSLSRIAEALGLPTSYFFEAGDRSKLEDTTVLKLVRAYLQMADPVARQHFVDAVKTIADDLSP